MNKSPGLLAAAVLALTLTGCATGQHQAPAQISKPGTDLTNQSQPLQQFHKDPVCRHTPCPR